MASYDVVRPGGGGGGGGGGDTGGGGDARAVEMLGVLDQIKALERLKKKRKREARGKHKKHKKKHKHRKKKKKRKHSSSSTSSAASGSGSDSDCDSDPAAAGAAAGGGGGGGEPGRGEDLSETDQVRRLAGLPVYTLPGGAAPKAALETDQDKLFAESQSAVSAARGAARAHGGGGGGGYGGGGYGGGGGGGGSGQRYRLYVGGLPFSFTSEALAELFAGFGQVADAKVITEREDPTRSRGFGFVSFGALAAMEAASAAMDGKELEGRPLRVNEAEQRTADGGGGGGGGGADRDGRGSGGNREPRGRGDQQDGGGGGGGGRRGGKYSVSNYTNLTTTVAEDQDADDAARLAAYQARKAARERARA
eukprot:SAG22_NODE_147_length_17533_cov_46.384536_4_plen_365_part_00